MRSLQSKLSFGLTLSLITLFTTLWFLISFSIQYLAEDYISSRLQHDAEMLIGNIQVDKTGQVKLDESSINPVYRQPYSGHYFLILSRQQNLSSRSLWDQQLQHTKLKPGEQFTQFQNGPDNQSLLVLSNGFSKQGINLTITVAEDLNPVKSNIRQFRIRFAIVAIIMLLLLVALQAYILRYSLKSLFLIRTELQALQHGEVDQLNENVPTELGPLVNEINHLLGAMEQRLRRFRDALSDLAHAIKRPLTVMQQLTDNNKNTMPDELNKGLVKQVTEINQLTDRILKRARLAGHHHSGSRFSFAHDLPELIETLKMMYRDKGITIEVVKQEEVYCPIDREDMLELLGNLIDNAYKWAKQKVKITIAVNAVLTICIEDDGPGADPQQFQSLDKRGVRLDEKTHGYGFGLSIASDMVSEYQGTLSFSTSKALGGFRVDVSLPMDTDLIHPEAT